MKLPMSLCPQRVYYRPTLYCPHLPTRNVWGLNVQKKHVCFHTNTISLMKQHRPSFKSSPRSTSVSNTCSQRGRQSSSLSGCDSRKQSEAVGTYIALGSNIGDRIGFIEAACRELSRAGIKVLRTSALYETKPMYVEDQDTFLNAVCQVSIPCLEVVTSKRSCC